MNEVEYMYGGDYENDPGYIKHEFRGQVVTDRAVVQCVKSCRRQRIVYI